jgi:two-component system, cell cycle sensor histidine kinase and response regulator CckA
MTLLLVDDEATLRKMVRAMLQRRGIQVIEAASAAEAMVLFEQHPIDILVTDVVMEGVDGRALAKSLQERNPALPVVYISGYPLDFHNECQACPRSAFLPKPFDPRDLVSAIIELSGKAA